MIGIDLTVISRIDTILDRKGQRFYAKCFSKKEQKLINNNSTFAGFYAAKEAASKAIGTGIGKECGFLDIKISKTSKGQPILKYKKHVRKKFKIKKSSLSITHDGGYAIAVVVIV